MKVPGCVLDIEDVSSADLRELSQKSQKTLRAAGVRKPVSFKLALACFKPACYDFLSIFIYNSMALEVESKHLSFCFDYFSFFIYFSLAAAYAVTAVS